MFIVVAFVTDACKDMVKSKLHPAPRHHPPPPTHTHTTYTNYLYLACAQFVDFHRYYYTPACETLDQMVVNSTNLMHVSAAAAATVATNGSTALDVASQLVTTFVDEEATGSVCRRETSLLFVLLMLGTRKYLPLFCRTSLIHVQSRRQLHHLALMVNH